MSKTPEGDDGMDEKKSTEFAPAERASTEEVESQYYRLPNLTFVKNFLDAVPNMSMVLNQQRQIVFANRAFVEFLGLNSPDELIGKNQCEAF
jgi:PAS domain-containing protein